MDVATRNAEIRDTARRLDRELEFIRRSMGVRPDLSLANHYACTAHATITELGNLVFEAGQAGVPQPVDFILGLDGKDKELQRLVLQISECTAIVTNRSAKVAAGAVLN